MRLKRARVTNYKSVLDSGWFSFDDLTCLVGKNESGKTAILEALEKLGSVRPERQDLRDTEYPRMNWSEYEESSTVDTAIRAEWQLDDDERAHLISILGDESLLTGDTVTVSKDYDNKLRWSLPLSVQDVADYAVKNSNLKAADKTPLASVSTTTDLIVKIKEIEEPTPQQEALLKELQERWPQGGVQSTVTAYLSKRLPKFVYYSQYDRLPGRMSMEQLLAHEQNNTLEQLPGARVFLALLSMVGTTATDIGNISTSEELLSKLEAVQTRLSKRIFEYWSQNKHLKVRFRFDQASPGDDAPFNSGKVFQTRIENTRHEATIRLDERSTGFIWFFSFLVWFSEVQKQYGENLVVLLDEPGLTLHARAQGDLLRYVREELLPKYQVIYTTHSPFMIDSANLLSCRTVEDVTGPSDEVLGTKVGDQVLSTDNDTLFPLQAALGYDLTQTLFVGEHSLLVEGPSDLLYLQWASAHLTAADRVGLDRRWTVVPCGGITKVPSFMSLFGGNRLHVAVLTDYGAGDKRKVKEIRESDLLQDGHVFTADMFVANEQSEADVEDMVGRELYLRIVNAAYSLKADQRVPAKKPEDSPERAVQEVEQHFKTLPASVPEFDHYAPAAYLISHTSDFDGKPVDSALDRFEELFKKLNQLL